MLWIGLFSSGSVRAKTAGVANSIGSNSHTRATHRHRLGLELHRFWLSSIGGAEQQRQAGVKIPLIELMKLKTL
jgi:hypothetical protein